MVALSQLARTWDLVINREPLLLDERDEQVQASCLQILSDGTHLL